MVYEIFATESFKREIMKLSEKDNKEIMKLFLQLKENPYVGDSLRFRFFREKRMREKRIYYLIYDNLSAVLVIAIGGKKKQQETIDYIIKDLPKYQEYMREMFRDKLSDS
tara:strand:- start:940 stop:1269 length:330 start_codon:yes stop_codon:yes gene_type:complete